MLGLVFGLTLVFLAKGSNMLAMKKVEVRRGSSVLQSLIFIVLFSLAQMLFLCLAPPYEPLRFTLDALLYPGAYALLYIVAYVLYLKAYSEGSVSMTNAIWSFNTIVVVAYGLCFWGEVLTLFQGIGLILFFVGLMFYSKSSYSTPQIKKKVTLKWLVLIISSTFIMGIATVFTKEFMLIHADMGKEFLFYYAAIATVIAAPICFILGARETTNTVKDRKIILYTLVAGLTSVVWNTVYVKYLTAYPSAVFLPMYSVVSMLGTLAFGIVVLRERISRNAVIATVLSLLSIVFLNLK